MNDTHPKRATCSEYALVFTFGVGMATVFAKLIWPTLIILAQAVLP